MTSFAPHFLCCHIIINVLEMFSFARMITSVSAALALASINSVLAAPTPDVSPLAARGVPASRFVIYSDNWVTGALPAASALAVSALFALT